MLDGWRSPRVGVQSTSLGGVGFLSARLSSSRLGMELSSHPGGPPEKSNDVSPLGHRYEAGHKPVARK